MRKYFPSVLAAVMQCIITSNALAQDAVRIEIPGAAAFPESIATDASGNLYGGSLASGGIWRIKPGATRAEDWIKPGSFSSRSTFGVLADDKAKLLWVCSNDVSFMGIAGPGAATGSHLKGFDLTSGEGRMSVALPGSPALCNDIAVGGDGNVYVSNSLVPQILRLTPGSSTFEVWAENAQFAPPAQGPGLDGIAIGGDGNIYVNTYIKGELFRVEQHNGAAREVTKLKTSRPLVFPDGLRTLDGTRFLMAEGGGTIDFVTVSGDTAQIETLKDGLLSPTGVALSGTNIWVTEGQLPHLFDAAKNGPPKLPFQVLAVPYAR
jgi:sugar lactone lactonase YvrE